MYNLHACLDNSSPKINGGPSCFGDSGGPLFELKEKLNNPATPVLRGVFSFMLWGTCRGRNEPSYYGQVKPYVSWIQQYIPKEDLCFG